MASPSPSGYDCDYVGFMTNNHLDTTKMDGQVVETTVGTNSGDIPLPSEQIPDAFMRHSTLILLVLLFVILGLAHHPPVNAQGRSKEGSLAPLPQLGTRRPLGSLPPWLESPKTNCPSIAGRLLHAGAQKPISYQFE